MAGKKVMGDKWQYTFKRKGLLDKPIYLTFENEEEGDAYAKTLDALLDQGIVPSQHKVQDRVMTIAQLIISYVRDANISGKDQEILNTVTKMVGDIPLQSISTHWVDGWVTDLKRIHKLKPSTIRAKVGALARCCDWGIRKGLLPDGGRPLRTLPEGYANYTDLDAKLADLDPDETEDTERDRRLEDGEEENILWIIERGFLERKVRTFELEHQEDLRLLFYLALESAMRLREMYTLTIDQVDFKKKTIFLDKTKNGDKRQVPMSTVILPILKAHIDALKNHRSTVFPWWNGSHDRQHLKLLSNDLSKLFSNIFKDAGCAALHFHDLRHEATSRLFERTTMSEAKIMKITGHKSHKMMMRYANLRGSDLADEMW